LRRSYRSQRVKARAKYASEEERAERVTDVVDWDGELKEGERREDGMGTDGGSDVLRALEDNGESEESEDTESEMSDDYDYDDEEIQGTGTFCPW
jgi:hypothetical protein